jgi:predicted permease
MRDLRYAFRRLFRDPVFSSVIILSLALGIGANTAIFTLLDQVLLRLLPVKNPEQLALLTSKGNGYGSNRGRNAISYPMYQDFRDHNTVFSGLICRYTTPVSLSAEGRTERITGELVSGNYFEVLGVGAAAGRVFTPDDDKVPNGQPVAVISYDFWVSRFGRDRNVIGKNVIVNDRSYSIIGVSQQGFTGVELGQNPQIRFPMMMKAQITPQWDDLKNRRSRWVNVFGRLKPGVTLQQATAALQPFFHQMLEMEVKEAAFANASPYTREQFLRATIEAIPGSQGRASLREGFSTPLRVLMAVVAGVLLIACANVANLLLARAVTRQKEIAVRLAIGGTRGRLIRQLLVESMLLAAIGAAAGIALAVWTDHLLLGLMPSGSNFSSVPDVRVLAFTITVAALTGLLFGLIPALQATRPNLFETLKDQAGAVTGGSGHVRLRKALVVTQIALSLLLLIGAGLFINSLRNLKNLAPGFRTTKLVSFSVDPSLSGYKQERAKAFYTQLTNGIGSLPGVESAALAGLRLIDDNDWENTVSVEGYVSKPDEDMNPFMNQVSPGFFQTMGIPILMGRDFTTQDNRRIQHRDSDRKDTVPTVAIINENFAKKYFGDRPAIGHHVGYGGDPGTHTDMEIIGVVGNTKYNHMRDEMGIQMYVPFLADESPGGMVAYVRTSAPSSQMFNLIQGEVRKADPNVPVYAMRTMEEQVDLALLTERLVATLSAVFGLLATLLAVIGLYGVMAYTVSRRTREVGIRMALGASQNDVVWMVMSEVLLLFGIGVVVALPSALALSGLVRAQVYGITPQDPVTMVVATAILAMVALAAGFIPARRAARIDPMRALRWE